MHLLFLSAAVSVPGWSLGSQEAPKTSWILSDGIQHGEDLYFLSRYHLYHPGKTIIPMFASTAQKVLYENFTLYRLTGFKSAETAALEPVWTYGQSGANRISIKFCRYGASEDTLYFSWPSVYPGYSSTEQQHATLKVDTRTGTACILIEEPAVSFDYHIEQKIKASFVGLYSARIPFSAWNLQSPLEQGQTSVRRLEKKLLNKTGDSHYREAVLTELYRIADQNQIQNLIKKLETHTDRMYAQALLVKITMDSRHGVEQLPPAFIAAYNNDAALLEHLIKAGTDVNSADTYGISLLRYALYGKAPDSLRLLFAYGADPDKDPGSALAVWMYAALSPLRPLYLELMENYNQN